MLEKELQAKVKHHHVWADYLRRWSPNNRDIYHTTSKGKIEFASVKGIAMEKHFYRTEWLYDSHIEIIKGFSRLSPVELQKQHMISLEGFLKRQELQAVCKKSAENSEYMSRFSQALQSNALENIHTFIEGEVKPIMSSLAERDTSVLQDSMNMCSFCMYIGHQFTRTKAFKETILSLGENIFSENHQSVGRCIEECWWFLSYLFGMNIGTDLHKTNQSDTHALLINDTETPFITSDQPVINVFKSLSNVGISPLSEEEFDLYYPISPTEAYMISKSEKYTEGLNVVSSDTVIELNTKMSRAANIHIMSCDEGSLSLLLRNIGSHRNQVIEFGKSQKIS